MKTGLKIDHVHRYKIPKQNIGNSNPALYRKIIYYDKLGLFQEFKISLTRENKPI